jgi:hypothetical protein
VSNSGSITLAEIAGKLQMLDRACSHCERRGLLIIPNLIERHGAGARLTDLREVLAGGRLRIGAASIHDRCGVHYPQLPSLFVPSPPAG